MLVLLGFFLSHSPLQAVLMSTEQLCLRTLFSRETSTLIGGFIGGSRPCSILTRASWKFLRAESWPYVFVEVQLVLYLLKLTSDNVNTNKLKSP